MRQFMLVFCLSSSQDRYTRIRLFLLKLLSLLRREPMHIKALLVFQIMYEQWTKNFDEM